MKAKIFHAGRGLWEVRYKKKQDGQMVTKGIGYFYPKKVATKIKNRLNKKGLP
jgi:hypothetical protein